MVSRLQKEIYLFGETLTHVLKNLVEFHYFYLTISIAAITYFLVNNQVIGIDRELLVIYAIILFGAVLLALVRKVDLSRLSWRPIVPFSGKYVKSPLKLRSIMIIGTLSLLITIIVTYVLFMGPRPVAITGERALNMAIQQLLIITLIETVVFQGILLLIIQDTFFRDIQGPEVKYAWLFIYTISQTMFGLIHYSIYGGSLILMFKVMILGTVWALLSKRVGPIAAWFSHAGYNWVALGIIGGI